MAIKDFVLASSSPHRLQLLKDIGYEPKNIFPADIDEEVKPKEKPLSYVRRITQEKAESVSKKLVGENILSSDTILVSGTKIIRKAHDREEEAEIIKKLSGHAHRVITAVCLIDKNGKKSLKTVTTKVIMKNLSHRELDEFLDSKEWVGVAGYKIDGMMGCYVKKIIGSYSGIVGLPLYETKSMLNGAGVF